MKPVHVIIGIILCLGGVFLSQAAFAQESNPKDTQGQEFVIKINQGVTRAINLAVVPFQSGPGVKSSVNTLVLNVISNDFRLSGHLRQMKTSNLPAKPFRSNQVLYKDWRKNEIDFLIFGEMNQLNTRDYALNLTIVDIFGGKTLINEEFNFPIKYERDFGHYIADYLYEKMTGLKGSFSTKIAFVRETIERKKRIYRLNIADSDGKREKTVLRSDEPIISPSWSPDGKKLAYVSFEHGRSSIYVQDIRKGTRWLVTAFKGINSAPAWSPDGKKLAVVLSQDANAEIYLIDLTELTAKQLTNNPAIDTEPAWSADGKKLVFTSDRIGNKPQIFEYDLPSAKVKRLTYDNVYTSDPQYTPDGEEIIMISRVSRGYSVTRMNLKDKKLQPITKSSLDDSPSVSPDGNRVIYSVKRGGNYMLAIASIDLGNPVYLRMGQGQVKSPAWSPFLYRFEF